MMQPQTWWWQNNDIYTVDMAVPPAMDAYTGSQGVALVRAFHSGSTDSGWGGDEFMQNYKLNKFTPRLALAGYNRGANHFAIVTRSLRLVCVDIDGKNGGIEHAAELLGNVPLTLAETSKSGNGYHLYFSYEDEWDEKEGFARLRDAIGIVQGVDIRSTGCVYHHNTQRWFDHPIVPLPAWIEQKLTQRQTRRTASITKVIETTKAGGWEALMQIERLLKSLALPVNKGSRNNTLFAIGSKLMLAGYEEWEEVVADRASELQLEPYEITKLLLNISKYGASQTV